MAETYLHTLYPNLTPQIDDALKSGYSLQETHDHIEGKINEARRSGYLDSEISQYTGANKKTPQGHNPFLAQAYKAAAAANRGMGDFTKGITEPGQYISKKLGFGRSETIDKIVDSAILDFKSGALFYEEKAREEGENVIDRVIGNIAGGAAPGMIDFMLDVSRAPISGAIEAESKGSERDIRCCNGYR